jgi:alanine-glyoxylate transaminase/serine-glyoxylate transaminase/serine-pyruvate transaminase
MNRCLGRHFLQIPGPTDVPGRVLRAISEPTIDHRNLTSPRSVVRS